MSFIGRGITAVTNRALHSESLDQKAVKEVAQQRTVAHAGYADHTSGVQGPNLEPTITRTDTYTARLVERIQTEAEKAKPNSTKLKRLLSAHGNVRAKVMKGETLTVRDAAAAVIKSDPHTVAATIGGASAVTAVGAFAAHKKAKPREAVPNVPVPPSVSAITA